MISFEDAFKIVLNSVRITGHETVNLNNSLNRILAQDVVSDIDMPPFDKSAMDGYACKAEDISNELTVIEIIPAGYVPKLNINKNECSKIMTGAMLPKGADCVIIIEETKDTAHNKIKFTGNSEIEENGNIKYFQKRKANICYTAEDIKLNETVLNIGTIIKPQHIAVLATVGCAEPLVSIRPKVGIIATGSELVEPNEKINGPNIRNSNSYQLFAQVEKMGAIPTYYGIAEDTEEAIDSRVKKAVTENDVLLISGGVSMGDFDLVPGILKKNGIKLLFDKIAIQPGKPTTFGISDDIICFGMPGNPVSTFVQFEILTKPLLYRMMGHNFKPNIFAMPLGKTIRRKKAERESIIPVFIKNNKAYQVEYHGSAHINAICHAEFLISIPVGITQIEEGSIVDVRQI